MFGCEDSRGGEKLFTNAATAILLHLTCDIVSVGLVLKNLLAKGLNSVPAI